MREEPLPRAVLIAECRSLVLGYLTEEVAESPPSEAVEFFGVWG